MRRMILGMLMSMIMLSIIGIFCLYGSCYAESIYSDIENTIYEDAVMFLTENGVVNGFPDGSFRPEETVTRAQLAKILVESLDLKEKEGERKSFIDVDESHWAIYWINIASENHLIIGYEDGSFRPDQSVNFAEAITMVVRGMDKEKEIEDIVWPDSYIQKADELNLLMNISYENDRNDCHRGYAAILVKDMMEVLEEEEPIITLTPTLAKTTTPTPSKTVTPTPTKTISPTPVKTATPIPTVTAIPLDVPITADGLINNSYFGIKKNGTKEDALNNRNAINRAIAYAAENKIPEIKLEKGIYLLDIPKESQGAAVEVIKLKSNMIFNLNGSTLQLMPNALKGYGVLSLKKVENVTIRNGIISGERFEHDYETVGGSNEWGHAIRITDSQNITVKEMELCYTTGDGVYVNGKTTQNIIIQQNEIHDVRRNGISIICVDGLIIKNNEIHDIYGANPQSAIDLERNNSGEFYKNVEICNNDMFNINRTTSGVLICDVAEHLYIHDNELTKRIGTGRNYEPSFEGNTVEEVMQKYDIKIYNNTPSKDKRINNVDYTTTVDNLNELLIRLPLQSIMVDPPEMTLKVGDPKQKLNVIYTPELFIPFRKEGQPASTTFTSSDPTIAKVGETTGNVTALKPGTAIITATTVDGKFQSTCTVTVLVPDPVPEIKLKGISLYESKLTLIEEQLSTLNPTLKVKFDPEDATNQNIIWTSSNETIAKVSTKGVVAPKKEGTCTITAIAEDGGYKAECEVTVIYVAVESMRLDQDQIELKVGGDTATINPITNPEIATRATRSWMKWSSSDKTVATVSRGIITPVGPGKCTITGITNNGKYSDTCEVTVK